MGMKNSAFYFSWIIYYGFIFTIISLLNAGIMKGSIFKNSDYSLLFFWYWIFCWSLIFQAIFISAFFSKAKVGNICAMLWFLANYIIINFLSVSKIPYSTKTAASLST